MKEITIKGFSNFNTETVKDPEKLAHARDEISQMLHSPHFQFKTGKAFTFGQILEALSFVSINGGKAVLKVS